MSGLRRSARARAKILRSLARLIARHASLLPKSGFPRRHGCISQQAPAAMDRRIIATTTNNIAGETMGPLTGLKVVDLTHVMAGPTRTLMLADMGAGGIKIEKIPAGDDIRYSVPPKIGDQAASLLMMNRNKKGIALDLNTPGAPKVLRRPIPKA